VGAAATLVRILSEQNTEDEGSTFHRNIRRNFSYNLY